MLPPRKDDPLTSLRIPYKTDGFPVGTVPNGVADLSCTWNDVLWAAVTVGRPSRQFVFHHGIASGYEAIFRWSLVRMALEQSGPAGYRLRRMEAAKTLDPSEQGAVNYFLGMTFCKLFATKLLSTPWLLHLDVFRPWLNPVLRGRSRPDLTGKEVGTNCWHAFECKGRVSSPDSTVMRKAKEQALRLESVHGIGCTLHIGAITHFRGDALHYYWRDPTPEQGKRIEVTIVANSGRYYYEPVAELFALSDREALRAGADVDLRAVGVDVQVGVHPAVAGYLLAGQWESAHRTADEAGKELAEAGY
jgi:hypothetical protein